MDSSAFYTSTPLHFENNALIYIEGHQPYPLSSIPSFKTAYALSIHKSQGSEFNTVICLIPQGSERFNHSLLYTGITRAKHTLSIYASLETLERIVLNKARNVHYN